MRANLPIVRFGLSDDLPAGSRDGASSMHRLYESPAPRPVEPEIVVTHLMEAIGIARDISNDRMFVTDFGGSVYFARLNGSGERNFLQRR